MTSEEITALREKVLALRCGAEDCVFGDDGRHGTVPCFCSGDMRDLDAGDEVLRAVPALLSAAEECERLRAGYVNAAEAQRLERERAEAAERALAFADRCAADKQAAWDAMCSKSVADEGRAEAAETAYTQMERNWNAANDVREAAERRVAELEAALGEAMGPELTENERRASTANELAQDARIRAVLRGERSGT